MTATNPYRPGRDHTSRTYPVVPPIYQTTTFELDDTSYDDIQGTGGLRETWYSRFNNPTVDAAAAEVARLHGAARSMMTASGMAAIATTLVTLLRSGDTVIASKQVYGDTDDLLQRDLPALGINVVRVDAFDTAEWERAAQELRSVTRRSVGEGLTRFTIDAPDAAAACLDGIITSTLAAPCPTRDENGEDVLDPRSAPQRRFDALITVVNRGLSNPGAAPSTARASVLLTIPFDPETGSPAGVGYTPTGLLVPHGIEVPELDLPVEWTDEVFLPYDWSYFAFVYDTDTVTTPPGSFEELIALPEDFKIVIQDPRSATPGLSSTGSLLPAAMFSNASIAASNVGWTVYSPLRSSVAARTRDESPGSVHATSTPPS